jgi:hypothetical protein
MVNNYDSNCPETAIDPLFSNGNDAPGYSRNDESPDVLLFFPVACHGAAQNTRYAWGY